MKNTLPRGTIDFSHVSKLYRLGVFGNLKGALSGWFSRDETRNPGRSAFWALRDVSFRLNPGQSLGLVGPNGSGKTTTLKLLSRVTYPTTGKISVGGRVSSLIELGAGFHPELSGRENIYLNGAILGLTSREITRKLDAIVAFSELEQFIDTPVKRYSSGMYVRLGFAVAAHVEPDILLVDEVLAVGDARFRQRCIQRMKELQENGTTMLFVSHNMHLVRMVCDQVALIYKGQLCELGAPQDVIAEYERMIMHPEPSGAGAAEISRLADSDAESGLFIQSVQVETLGPQTEGAFAGTEPARINIHYRAAGRTPIGRVLLLLQRDDGTVCCAVDSSHSPDARLRHLSGDGVLSVLYSPLQLTSGSYLAEVMITDTSDNLVIASGQSGRFDVYGTASGPSRGIYVPNATWLS